MEYINAKTNSLAYLKCAIVESEGKWQLVEYSTSDMIKETEKCVEIIGEMRKTLDDFSSNFKELISKNNIDSGSFATIHGEYVLFLRNNFSEKAIENLHPFQLNYKAKETTFSSNILTD